jgi:osmotically inducible protein OsmC
MALKRTSSVVWHGDALHGDGAISTLSGAFKDQPYSAKTRFMAEDGRAGTNPEELLAASHAGCFTMAVSYALSNAGHVPTELRTVATVTLDNKDSNWSISNITLEVTGNVPGITAEQFQALAADAKKNCPISRALAATPISMMATLG